MGLFQHCTRRLIVLLPPNGSFIHLANPEFTKVLGSFTCRKAGTWDRFFHFPSEGKHAEDYSDTRKKSNGFGRVRTRELGYQRPAC